jgi:predicted NACHT family NTPase
VSARPAGYAPGALRELGFVDCEMRDLDDAQVCEFTRHWSTAVRLARNEPESEARRVGVVDGERIAVGFQDHPYIRHLARNPLMLSAICLVNYFEGSDLPQDRALLYRLCVEGLLHNWDRRRGIRSDYSFDEKLRVCREVALAMQADDRAEYEGEKVLAIVGMVLADPERAAGLLEHIRYRTGLLLERRPGVFAFAHLTFQEYLAARAVYEGNWRGIDVEHLVQALDDGRWQEVIPLYCGLVPAPAARALLELLLAVPECGPDSALPGVLLEAFGAAGPEIMEDNTLRRRVVERVAATSGGGNLAAKHRNFIHHPA